MCVKTDLCFCLVRELKTFSHWSDFFGEIAAKTTDDRRRRESERKPLCVKPGVLRTDCQAASRETAIQ